MGEHNEGTYRKIVPGGVQAHYLTVFLGFHEHFIFAAVQTLFDIGIKVVADSLVFRADDIKALKRLDDRGKVYILVTKFHIRNIAEEM